MKTIRWCLLGVLFMLCMMASPASAQEGGMFSPYLVGTYDVRNGNTLLQIVNPTAKDLEIFLAFFDDNEKPLRCVKEKISHNDLVEINVKSLELGAKFGVVKIVSMLDMKPHPGIVGFQRHILSQPGSRVPYGATESNLAAVPAAILEGELDIIMKVCHK